MLTGDFSRHHERPQGDDEGDGRSKRQDEGRGRSSEHSHHRDQGRPAASATTTDDALATLAALEASSTPPPQKTRSAPRRITHSKPGATQAKAAGRTTATQSADRTNTKRLSAAGALFDGPATAVCRGEGGGGCFGRFSGAGATNGQPPFLPRRHTARDSPTLIPSRLSNRTRWIRGTRGRGGRRACRGRRRGRLLRVTPVRYSHRPTLALSTSPISTQTSTRSGVGCEFRLAAPRARL